MRSKTLAIFLFAIVNATLHLGLLDHWWFEDDPAVWGVAQSVSNVFSFFYDPTTSHGAVGRNEVAPVLMASAWLDTYLAQPAVAAVAYSHSILLYALTSVAFFIVVKRLVSDSTLAFVVACTWILAPSVVSVAEFLTTRHYMYGMLFALASFELSERLSPDSKKYKVFNWTCLGVCLWLAIISKELYPPALLTFVFLRFVHRRMWGGCILSGALAVAYAVYRFWMTEPELSYRDIPLPTISEYARFLARLPYMLFANYMGYVWLMLATFVYYLALRKKPELRIPSIIALLGIICALATLTPVAISVSNMWQNPGTWYRTPFAVNTLLIIFMGYTWSKLSRRWLALLLACLMAITSAAGGYRTGQKWARMKEEQRAEGSFYLSNPGKLLFSSIAAVWFLPGLKILYPKAQTANLVIRWPRLQPSDRERLLAAPEVWVHRKGKMMSIKAEKVRGLLERIPQ